MINSKTWKENPLVYLFCKTWQYSQGNHHKIILFWFMFVVAESIDVFLMPLVWAKVIDIVALKGVTTQSIYAINMLLCVVFARVITTWGLHGPARVMECDNAFIARRNYRQFLTCGLLALPLEWHTDHHSGDTIDKTAKGTTAIHDFSESSFEIIYCLVRLFGSYGMLVYFSHSASYIVVVLMLISAWITTRFDRVLIKNYKEINKSENQMSESIFDAISNVSTVVILRVEKLVFEAIMHKVEKPFELIRRTNVLNQWKWFTTAFCVTLLTIVVLEVYLWQHLGALPGTLTASVYLLVSYLNRIGDLFFQFCGRYGEIMKRKTRVINAEELAKDFVTGSFTNHVLPEGWKQLQIRQLSFSYHMKEEGDLHLDDISLSLKRGEKIAFVGESGSGKTTLLKIMRDLYHPQSVELLVDGVVVPQGFDGISRAIALVPQDPELFAATILSNITMGAEYDMSLVQRYVNMACFTDVLQKLPKGLESSIREKGVNLSVGQKQRLALARGFLACHGKDIVLLDEPTSSLDASNEMRIYQNIFRGFTGKTIVSAIHRLHLLPLFDRICVFDKGRIVADGTLDELLSSCEQFKQLWGKYTECQEGDSGLIEE